MNAEKNAELIYISDHMEKAVCGYIFTHGECRRILYDTLQIDFKMQNFIYKNRRVLKKFLKGIVFEREGIRINLSSEEMRQKIQDALRYEIARCFFQPARLTRIFAFGQEFSLQEKECVDACLRRLGKIDFSAVFTPDETAEYRRLCADLRSVPLPVLRKMSVVDTPERALIAMIPSFRLDFSPERYPNVQTLFCCFAKEFYSEKY